MVFERIRGPIDQGAQSPCWVIAGVLRIIRSANDKDVGNVPALAITIDNAGAPVRSHHGSTGVVRCLIHGSGEGPSTWCIDHRACAHSSADFSGSVRDIT